MRSTRSARRAGARRRTALLVLLAAAGVALGPAVWLSYDLMLRTAYGTALLVTALVLARRRLRGETPAQAYARALGESSAMHVHLGGVRIAAVHVRPTAALLTLTWRSATTALLDADGRTRAEVARNGLTSAYTLTIALEDPVAVGLLDGETGLGSVSVYATTDLFAHPTATLRSGRVVVDQYDLVFPCWSGSLQREPVLAGP